MATFHIDLVQRFPGLSRALEAGENISIEVVPGRYIDMAINVPKKKISAAVDREGKLTLENLAEWTIDRLDAGELKIKFTPRTVFDRDTKQEKIIGLILFIEPVE